MSPRQRLNNFSDPFGLLGRMLSSGNRAAYAALLREGCGYAAKPFDAVLSLFERQRLKRETKSSHPLIFIVGAPRSGTTLIYQTLATYLDVTYPSNLTSMFPRSPIAITRMQRMIPTKRRPDFRNFYGQTTRLRGPNDAFHIWNRWLGDDRYHPEHSLNEETIAQMRQFFDVWCTAFGKPFLNKNNRNTFAIARLAEQLPNAHFIVVRRNPLFVAQSLIIARQKVQGDKSVGWGLDSHSTEENTAPLAYVDDVCRQIVSIDKEMNRQLATVAAGRVQEVTYEGFCEDPGHRVAKIAAAIDGLELNPDFPVSELPPFAISNEVKISKPEQHRIRKHFAAPQPESR